MANNKEIKKRKVDFENRRFNIAWTEMFLFIEHNANAVCLVCLRTVAVFKKSNIESHFKARYEDNYKIYEGILRINKIEELRRIYYNQTNFFNMHREKNFLE